MRSSLFLIAPSSCSENLPHLELISLRSICFASAGLLVLAEAEFGVTEFMSVISKISMKHHLNVHHSNNNLLCGDELREPQGQSVVCLKKRCSIYLLATKEPRTSDC